MSWLPWSDRTQYDDILFFVGPSKIDSHPSILSTYHHTFLKYSLPTYFLTDHYFLHWTFWSKVNRQNEVSWHNVLCQPNKTLFQYCFDDYNRIKNTSYYTYCVLSVQYAREMRVNWYLQCRRKTVSTIKSTNVKIWK